MIGVVAILFFAPSSMPVEATQQKMRLGVNYLSDGNAYSDTTNTILTRDFTLFKNNNITDVMIRLVWSAVESDTKGHYVTSVINNVKRALNVANTLGLEVHISFWTHFQEYATWSVPAYVKDPYTGKRITLAIVRSDSMKQAWLNMVSYVVTQLQSYHAIAAWHVMNEPMYDQSSDRSGLDQANFQALWTEAASLIRNLDSQNRPCSVRFAIADSPWSGDFDLSSINSLDFVGVNVYVDYRDFDRLAWGSWSMVYQAIRDTHARSKEIWWTEFGAWSDNLTVQDNAFKVMLDVAKAESVDGVMAWAWQSSDPSAERYNICLDSNGHAAPAFYELASSSTIENPPTGAVLGDLSGDGKVDIIDLVIVCTSFNSQAGEPGYNPIADVNGDSQVNIIDLTFVTVHFGEHGS